MFIRILIRHLAVLLLPVLVLAGCRSTRDTTVLPLLTGRAVLPADTFSPGPAVGSRLEPRINGRDLPFASVPVQGFSSLLPLADGSFLALQDNGFGTLANSPDYPLRWFQLHLDLESNKPHGGTVTVEQVTTLRDPEHLTPFPLVHDDSTRTLRGADFDPESFVRLDDGTFWVGDEFGPCLLHFSGDGRLLESPVPVPVPPALRPFGHGSYILRSPDHPDLRFGGTARPAAELANLPRSGGIEGLARNHDGSLLFVSVEKALRDDPRHRRRSILEFDTDSGHFTSRFWFYRTDTEHCSLSSLEAFSDNVLLVLERDEGQGDQARVKRIYRVDLRRTDDDGFLAKTLVCDLLRIRDNLGFTAQEEGALGFGPDYSFPYVTPESLVILDQRTLLVVNDNNYPMSSGRRPPDTPDDSEFIRIRLPESIRP